MISLSQNISHKPWRWWVLFLALVLAAFLPSLGCSPVFRQDEVQIVDYGRVLLDPGTDWAVTWSVREQKAMQAIPYLGCIGAELAYRITGTVLGPRLLCIAGAFLMGSLVLAMVRQQPGPAVIGVLFAGLVVLDPALVAHYRAGRLDALAMALVLGGAWCLQRYAGNPGWRWLVAAALALACAPYVWPRALMALPAALLPLVFATQMPSRKMLRAILAITTLTVLAGALLLPPAWQALRDLRALVDSPVQEFRTLSGNSLMSNPSAIILRMIDDSWQCLRTDTPLLLLAACGLLVAIVGKGLEVMRKVMIALLVVATLFCQLGTTTSTTSNSALYLLPLLILLSWHGIATFACSSRRIRWATAGTALLLACDFGAAADQSYDAWLNRGVLGADALQPVVKALPPLPQRLIVDDFRLYFLLRQKGFHSFYLFTDLDHTKHQFRFYAPSSDSDFQPFYLFTQKGREGRGETFSPASTPGLLVGGGTLMWSAFFEMQLRHPQVKQLPLGYRLVVPHSK